MSYKPYRKPLISLNTKIPVNQLVVGSIPTVGAKKPHKYQVFMQAPREGSLSCVGWGNIWGNAQLSASKRYWNRYRTADVMCTVRWGDLDSDCQNTRHELLAELSTAEVLWDHLGCVVKRGRWIDPYTDKIFTDAGDLDVDHLVPLAYAHARGAFAWPSEKRTDFANDPRNLFAVEASVYRSKGSRGPSRWLPPNEAFRCQYIVRFIRIMMIYDLQFDQPESDEIEILRAQNC